MPWGDEGVNGPESIVQLRVVAESGEVPGRFVRVAYKEKEGDMDEREE
jgi:hypothetical protein